MRSKLEVAAYDVHESAHQARKTRTENEPFLYQSAMHDSRLVSPIGLSIHLHGIAASACRTKPGNAPSNPC